MLRCGFHRRAFTLYPPDYAPYQRAPVLKQAPDGTQPISEPTPGTDDRLRKDFEGTIFDAALDAKDGRAWPRNSRHGAADRSWGNQLRQLDAAAWLLGVAPEIADHERDQIAEVLSVDALVLREEAAALKTVPGYRRLGAAIVTVLGKLRSWADQALRLLFAGYLAGRWGKPLRWDPERRGLFSLPFPIPGTGPPS